MTAVYRDEPSTQEARPVNLSCKRSTRPTPGPTSLWKTSLLGAIGCGRVGASFFAFSTFQFQRGSSADGPADGVPVPQPVTTVTCVDPSEEV